MPPKAKNFSICFAHDLHQVPTLAVGTPVYITDNRGDWYLVVFKNANEMSYAIGIDGMIILMSAEIKDLEEKIKSKAHEN